MVTRFVTASVVVLITAGFCAGDGKKDDQKDDKARLQGEWPVVSLEVSGKKSDGLKGKKLVVKEDEWTAPGGLKFKIKLDTTKNPKQIDHTSEDGKVTLLGIYKIEGDTLTLCQSRVGGERPTEFKAGPMVLLMVYKREGK